MRHDGIGGGRNLVATRAPTSIIAATIGMFRAP